MEIDFIGQKIEAERLLCDGIVQLPVRAEALISGAGRGEAEVLMADASARLTRFETENDRAVLEGEIVCQAAYRLHGENNARAANASAAVSHVFEVKGAVPGMPARGELVIEDVFARCENGHLVFDVSVAAHACVTELAPLNVITGVLPEGAVEMKKEEIVSSKIAAENTVTFSVSEKTALPAQLDARYALMEWGEVSGLSVRAEPGGVRVTGSVTMETLLSGGLAARPVALIKYRMPVDRYLEMPEWLINGVTAQGRVLRSSTEVEQAENGEDSTLLMEAEIEVGVLAEAADRVTAVTDVFATGSKNVTSETAETEMCLSRGSIHFEEPFRASVILPGGAGAVGTVCAVKTRASVADVEKDGAKSVIMGVVNAQVIYMSQSEEKLTAVRSDLPFSVTAALPIDSASSVRVRAVNAEGNALMSDRVEIKCMLEISCSVSDRRRVKTVSSIIPGEETERKHGCVLVWPDGADDAWSIAKRLRVPVENVKNASSDGVSVGKPIVLRV